MHRMSDGAMWATASFGLLGLVVPVLAAGALGYHWRPSPQVEGLPARPTRQSSTLV